MIHPHIRKQLDALEHQHPGAMVVLLDSVGVYLYASDACRTVLEYEPDEVIGQDATQFSATEDIPHVIIALQDALLNDESVTVSIRVKAKDGRLHPARGAAQRLVDPDTGEIYLSGWVVRSQ